MNNPAVCMENYTKTIGKKVILDHINLNVAPGETIWIRGENGSGKTMLLRAISGLIFPDSGSITIFGKELKRGHRFPESLGILIETIGFCGNMTGFQTLKCLASIRNTISDRELQNVLEKIGLKEAAHIPVRKYSLGMKQRLSIAQAIMENPRLLLLDEPLNGLDQNGMETVRDIITEEKNKGTTILIASHIGEGIENIVDREVHIKQFGQFSSF